MMAGEVNKCNEIRQHNGADGSVKNNWQISSTVYWNVWLYIQGLHTENKLSAVSQIARFMGPTWGWQDPGGPHVDCMNFAIWDNHDNNI